MKLVLSLVLLVALTGCSLLERARSNFWYIRANVREYSILLR